MTATCVEDDWTGRQKPIILVAVWTDSFEEAAVVRDAAVRSGFEYTLRPFPEDERLRFGGSDQPIHVQ